MPVSTEHIIEALRHLGGEAPLSAIAARVREIAPAPLPANVGASVRARMQERCADAASYEGRENLFECVYGTQARKGIWRLRAHSPTAPSSDDVLDGAEAFIEANEGRVALRIHLDRERSKKLIEAFKASLRDPRCEACGMTFAERYGELGNGYIEVHHRVPVASLDGTRKTKLSELAALCANCHRIIHKNDLMPVEKLAEFLASRANSQGT